MWVSFRAVSWMHFLVPLMQHGKQKIVPFFVGLQYGQLIWRDNECEFNSCMAAVNREVINQLIPLFCYPWLVGLALKNNLFHRHCGVFHVVRFLGLDEDME